MVQKHWIFLFIAGLLIHPVKADEGPFQRWAAGINVGLYGPGIAVATSLSPNLKLRTGFDYFTYSREDLFHFDTTVEGPQQYEMTVEGEITEAEITFPNFKIMLDYYPMKNSIFSLTGGIYLGSNNIGADGIINDYAMWAAQLGEDPEFRYEDIVIRPNSDGTFSGKLHMGNSIKPYFGLGLGRTIPRNRVGFKFELGLVYQGKYELESNNVNEAGNEWINSMAEELELPVSQSTLNWWPMLNFTLSVRIR